MSHNGGRGGVRLGPGLAALGVGLCDRAEAGEGGKLDIRGRDYGRGTRNGLDDLGRLLFDDGTECGVHHGLCGAFSNDRLCLYGVLVRMSFAWRLCLEGVLTIGQ